VLAEMMAEIRDMADCNFYIIGDRAFVTTPLSALNQGFELLDRITN
jgi:hypothetical protein